MKLGPIVLRVKAVVENAFDAIYHSNYDNKDVATYPYHVILFEDRHGQQYWWAQGYDRQIEPELKIPAWEKLKPGQFIKCAYEVRDELPGTRQNWNDELFDDDVEWDSGELSGESIYYLDWKYAPTAERWPVGPAKRSRMKGNLANGSIPNTKSDWWRKPPAA